MKRWWQLWSGHVLAGLAIAVFALSGVLVWYAARSYEQDVVLLSLLGGALAFLLSLCLGALAAWRFRTHYERWYIRNQRRISQEALPPVGEADIESAMRDGQDAVEAQDEAHSAGQKVI